MTEKPVLSKKEKREIISMRFNLIEGAFKVFESTTNSELEILLLKEVANEINMLSVDLKTTHHNYLSWFEIERKFDLNKFAQRWDLKNYLMAIYESILNIFVGGKY